MSLRLRLVAHLLACWVLGLLGLFVFAVIRENTGEGIWAVPLLAFASMPLIAIATVVILTVPRSIHARPLLWGSIAVGVSVGTGFAVASGAGLIFAASIAIPALLLFVGSLKMWPGLEVR